MAGAKGTTAAKATAVKPKQATPPAPEVKTPTPAEDAGPPASAVATPEGGPAPVRHLTDEQLEKLRPVLDLNADADETAVLAAVAQELLGRELNLDADADEAATLAALAGEVVGPLADDLVEVEMRVHISGTRDGQPWPLVGETIALPSFEAADYVRSGYARYPDEGDERP